MPLLRGVGDGGRLSLSLEDELRGMRISLATLIRGVAICLGAHVCSADFGLLEDLVGRGTRRLSLQARPPPDLDRDLLRPFADDLAKDAAVQAADTVLLTVPSQLGVDYNAAMLETIAREIAPALGWSPKNLPDPVC